MKRTANCHCEGKTCGSLNRILSLILSLLMVFGVFFASAVTVNAGTNSHPWYEVYPNALTNNWRFWGYGEYLFYIDSSGATMYPHDSFPKSSGNTSVYVPQWVYNPRDYDTAASGGTGGYWPDFPVAGVTGFENFDSIWYVTLNPKHVNSQAFKNCTNLRKINISNNLISIYDESFDGCYRLEKVTFSYTPNLMSIDKGAFSYCSNLTGFYNDNDNSICVLDDLYYIGEEAFLGCLKLTDFCCPNVKEIGQKAFKGCESLKSFLFSDNITAIKNGTFEGCSSLRQVYLSDSITSIGERAFADTSIYKLYIPPTVTEIADDAFADSALSMIYGENDSYAETWAIEHGIPFYGAYEYTVNTDNTVTITKCNLDTIRNIPTTLGGKTVTRIGNSAFQKVKFYECGSYTCPLNLNADIKYIGEYAFTECNITKIENLYAQTIEPNAFYGCFYLKSIKTDYEPYRSDMIDVKTIGDMAFNSCNLEKMTFSKSITSIGSKAIGYIAGKKIDGFTIYGYSNTVAKTYADENGFTFVSLDTFPTITSASCTVTEPVIGQKPSYTATVPTGKGYQVEEDFTDGTWKNGVLWHNDTDNKDMIESEIFENGKQYTATVLLDSAADYPFASNVSGILNGKDAEVINYGDGTIAIYRTFTCTATVISDFSVTNIIEPVAGASPSYIAAVPADKGYRVKDLNGTYTKNGVMWRNENNERLDPSTAVFEAGKVYKVYVYLEPVSDAYELASSDRTGTVNGKEADVWIDSSQNHVFLIASFTCKSSAIFGDVDFDGNIEIRDATWIQRSVAEIEIPFVIKKLSADVDGDGNITVMDATAIQYYLANMKTPYKIGEKIE